MVGSAQLSTIEGQLNQPDLTLKFGMGGEELERQCHISGSFSTCDLCKRKQKSLLGKTMTKNESARQSGRTDCIGVLRGLHLIHILKKITDQCCPSHGSKK